MMPCENPSCKSFGRAHPNCRCHAEMAEGGVVDHFCSNNKTHKPECEYAGGEYSLNFNNDPRSSADDVSAFHAEHGIHGMLHHNIKGDNERYHKAIQRGHASISDSMESLFTGRSLSKRDHSQASKAIDDWMEKGGITHDLQQEVYAMHEPESFAEGGEVKKKKSEKPLSSPNVGQMNPEHELLLQASKGRISNYLNSMRPTDDMNKLAFDRPSDQTQQKRAYNKARDIAAHPMGIMNHVANGTLDPTQVQHFTQMYPELNDLVQKKLTEKITQAQLSGKRPSYKVRQSLSLLMGVPLSSDLSPANIQAAQAVFRSQKAQATPPQGGGGQPAPKAPKSSKTALDKSSQAFLTGPQALASRSQRQ